MFQDSNAATRFEWLAHIMPMQCNIDAKGKAVRLIWGIAMLLIAAGLVVLTLLEVLTGLWTWISIGICTFFGLLGVYEARKGWCVVRAMGIKTKY